jgi:hypothetical protein
VAAVSASAKEKIEKAGGQVALSPQKTGAVKKKAGAPRAGGGVNG